MNYARILIGGLVAGLVLNIGEFLLNGVLLASQMEEFFRRCGLTPPSTNALIGLFIVTFILGIVIVFIYAAIRPRLGPGVKTAIVAGVIAWLCVYFYNNVVGYLLGFVPTNLLLIALVFGFVEYILGAIAGAWVYKEA
ncbi:MAG TPA: hypothetical protein VGW36_03125 [Pyrinomonadaceae bacterium]|nr:hypothetical protein [Pyrinomonadaceae bacterium]